MKISVEQNKINLSGPLDERDKVSDLIEVLARAKSAAGSEPVIFDFANFQWCTSAGLVVWLKFLEQLNQPVVFRALPLSIITHLNSIEGMMNQFVQIESFYAPFFSESADDISNKLFVVGKDVSLRADYSEFKVDAIEVNGAQYEADFEPKSYLQFLTKNYESNKAKEQS